MAQRSSSFFPRMHPWLRLVRWWPSKMNTGGQHRDSNTEMTSKGLELFMKTTTDDALQVGRLPILKSPPSRPAGRAHLYHVRQQKPTAKLPEKTRTLITSTWCKNTTSWISTFPLTTAMSSSFRGNACSTRPRFSDDEHKTRSRLVPECRLIFQASSRPKHYSPG